MIPLWVTAHLKVCANLLICPAPYVPNIQRCCRDNLRGIQIQPPTDCSDLNFSLRCPQSQGRCLNLCPSWQDEVEQIHGQSWKLWLLLSSLPLSTLLSETPFLLEKWEPMPWNSAPCAEFWDLQMNSKTDGWLYPAFTTCLMGRRQESSLVTLCSFPATKCCRRIELSNAWGKV